MVFIAICYQSIVSLPAVGVKRSGGRRFERLLRYDPARGPDEARQRESERRQHPEVDQRMAAGTDRGRRPRDRGETHGEEPVRDAAGRAHLAATGQPLSRWLGQSR